MAVQTKLSSFLLLLLVFLSLSFTHQDSHFMSEQLLSLPSTSKYGLGDQSLNRFITFVIQVCRGDQDEDSCQALLSELTTSLSSSLSEMRRLDLLKMFLKNYVWRVKVAIHVMNKAEDPNLIDCEELLESAKDRMMDSMEELRGGNPNLESYENVHTWLSGVLTSCVMCMDGVSGVSKHQIEPELDDLVSRARVALAIFVSISPVRDDQLQMVVPDGFPSWLSDVDKKFLDCNPEALKTNADIVVSNDGTGDYKTVKEAIDAAPEYSKRRYIIYVKKGIYSEVIEIGEAKKNLTLVGDGRDATILTGSLSDKDGFSIKQSATLATNADGFMAQDIWFQNTAGPLKGQAVALRVSGDASVIYRCRIDGYQDTLLADKHRQFYRDCHIMGTIDFIFGDAAAVFQNCQIEARRPLSGQSNVVTAQAREDLRQNSGFSIHKCNITASSDLAPIKRNVKTYLGRPWQIYSRVVVMESFIDDLIGPEGWAPWNGTIGLSTLYYGEYENRGPGADTSNRVKWKGYRVITDANEAAKFTVKNLLYGELWLNYTGVPYEEGL